MKQKYYISTILVFISIILYSCEIKKIENTTNNVDSLKHAPFKGIGELIVDTPFEKISNYKKFKKNGNIYSLEKYEISKEIGVVEFVEVELNEGLIYKVRFVDGPFTKYFNFKINDTLISLYINPYNNDIYMDYSRAIYSENNETNNQAKIDEVHSSRYNFRNDFLSFYDKHISYLEKKYIYSKYRRPIPISSLEEDAKLLDNKPPTLLQLNFEPTGLYEYSYESRAISELIEIKEEKIKQYNDSLNKAKYMQDVVR